MKLLLILFLGLSLEAFTQDTVKLKQIDILVSQINNADLKINHDTIMNDIPAVGLKMKTILTASTDNGILKKFTNSVISTENANGIVKETVGVNTFYFDQNKLIKVEEYLIKDNEKKQAEWYYADDKPLHYTVQTDRSKERAELLLLMGKTMLGQFKN